MSGFGVHFNAQHRRWQYAKGCPKHLRPFFRRKVFGGKGEPFERRYLDSAPREDTAAAKRIAIARPMPRPPPVTVMSQVPTKFASCAAAWNAVMESNKATR